MKDIRTDSAKYYTSDPLGSCLVNKCDIRHTYPQVRKTRTNVRLALPSMVTQERPDVKQSAKIDDFDAPSWQLLPANSPEQPKLFTKVSASSNQTQTPATTSVPH